MAVWSVVNSSLVSDEGNRIDAEYYKPDSLKATNIIKSLNYKNISELVQDGYRVVYENTKILQKTKINVERDARFLQATNISTDGLWIDINEIGFVHEIDWNRYPKGRIKHGEVLIEVKGEAEKVTIVQDYVPERTLVTGTLFKMTLNSIVSPEYLFAFMNSKYGKLLRNRTKVNTLIAYVSKPELYKIPVYIPSTIEHENITTMIQSSFYLMKQSQTLYKEAEKLLEKELGLDGLEFEKPRSYTAKLSEVYSHNRCDADFYQTKFRQIEEHINTLETLPLRKISMIQKGFEVGTNAYVDSGKLFIRVSNFTKNGFSQGGSDKYISDITYAKHIVHKPNIGDILLTKDGTVGVCYVVDSDIEGIISSGIVKLLPIDETIPKEYLSLVINSKLCQMQIQRDCSGALIVHWKPEDIRNLKIPILSEETMNSLANMVTQSKQAFKQSKQLLEDAKAKVEALIEEASR